MATERVVVIGGGIGGLAVALSLEGSGREVLILERDPEPPDISPDRAFDEWQRPGVPQFRHAHIFLARLQTALRDRHPELLTELLDAGLELSSVQEMLPPSQLADFQQMPGDDDLLHLWGRRPTFEYVLRRYVGRLPHVRFIHSARASGILTASIDGREVVRAVEYMEGPHPKAADADITVDCSGKRSKTQQWLEERGVRIEVDSNPSGFVYACRHYRLKDPLAAPPRRDGGGNLDFLGYATFYAEHGNYALTFGCPDEEKVLAHAMHRTEGFEALCDQFPVLERWTTESEATSKVLGAGLFENRWTRFGVPGGRELEGFFAVGDSHVETNPMYGRGCASAFVQAEVLREALDLTLDPSERARHYYARTRTLLKPCFDISISTDRMYHTRAKLRRGLPIPLGARFLNHAYEAAWLPAMHGSPLVAREFLKSVEMREISSIGIRLLVAIHVFVAWMRSLFGRKKAPLLTPGPARAELLRRLPAHEEGGGAEG